MVPVNRGSTMRDILTPEGNEDFPAVRRSNKMTSRMVCFETNTPVAWRCMPLSHRVQNWHHDVQSYCSPWVPPTLTPLRTVILMWITILSGGVYFMENPLNSLLAMHHRYIWMVDRLKEFGIPAAQRIFGLNFVFPPMGLLQTRGYLKIQSWMV